MLKKQVQQFLKIKNIINLRIFLICQIQMGCLKNIFLNICSQIDSQFKHHSNHFKFLLFYQVFWIFHHILMVSYLLLIYNIKQYHMIEYLVPLLLGIVVIGYIIFVYQPKKRLLWYKNVYEALGYKVKFYDFEAFKLGNFQEYQNCKKKYGDVLYSCKQEETTQCDVILHNLLHKVQVMLINPQLIKIWLAPENLKIFQKEMFIVQNLVRIAGGPGLAFSQGDIWKKKRKASTKAFNHQFLLANIPNMKEICKEAFDQIECQFQKNNPNRKNEIDVNIGEIYTQVFSKIMLQIFFGRKANKKKVNGEDLSLFFMELVADANKLGQKQPIGLILGTWYNNLGLTAMDRSINKRTKIMRVIAKQMINEQIQIVKSEGFNKNSVSILEALLKQYSQNNQEQSLDKINIDLFIEDFNIFFMAGTDTTTSFTKNMIYYLGQNPRVFQKLKQEVDKHIIQKSDQVNWQKIKQIQYLDWVQNEMIRVFGPANLVFLRVAKQDTLIQRLPVKKGDLVMYDSTPTHYNPKIYKNPNEFRPERWESQCKQIHPFSFLGFSSGPRSCIGKTLAILQNKIAIVDFVKRYKSINLHNNELKLDFRLAFEITDFTITLEKNK